MKTLNKISKANEKLFSILDDANDINSFDPSNDYDTREGYICANIKVYEWIDENNVQEIIKDYNLNENEIQEIQDEFNENRLNSIYRHTCEDEVYHFIDFVGGCAHTNFNKLKQAFNYVKENNYYPIELKFYFQNYIEAINKHKNIKEFCTYLETTYEQEYKEFYYLQEFNTKEIYTFGRSGGWLSIIEERDIQNFCEDASNIHWYLKDAYYNEDNKKFNEIIKEHSFNYESLNEARERIINETKQEIQSFEEKKQAIDWLFNYIEESKKYFKENLVNRLREEITSFIESELSIDIQIREFIQGNDKLNFIKEINEDFLITNQNAKVKIKDALNFIKMIKQGINVINQKVGPYTINKIVKENNLTFVKIGCHIFNLEKTERELSFN